MPEEAYEILSLFMRYVFLLLGIAAVLRAFRWLYREHRVHKRQLKRLPDAGYVGELTVPDTGKHWPLPAEGTLGSGAGCDIRVKGKGLRRLHCTFRYVKGRGLEVTPVRGAETLLDRAAARPGRYALSGSTIEAGQCLFEVRLFAGMHAPKRAAADEDERWMDLFFDDSIGQDPLDPFAGNAIPQPNIAGLEDDPFADPRYDGETAPEPDDEPVEDDDDFI